MKTINVNDFKKVLEAKVNDPSLDFINVCTPEEYTEKHIQGVRSVPLDTLNDHIQEFEGKKSIYIHCKSGKRAAVAIATLKDQGITADLINVEGGILAWIDAGFETIK